MNTRDAHQTRGEDFWRALLHRWLIEYNPAYLLSAAFVLGGVWLVSRDVATNASVGGQLAIGAIAEVYAFALIGSAAFLWRIQLRRPAVMLALLAALYQCDLTLHVETSAYLGSVGLVASVVWAVSFGLKLRLLVWALKLRLSWSAWLLSGFGALGMAALPHLLREVEPLLGVSFIGLWLFALGALAMWSAPRVHSSIGFDIRGLRAVRATWGVWAVLALAHALYWADEHRLAMWILMPAAALLGTRWIQRESRVWLTALATLVLTGVFLPGFFWTAALMASVVLSLRALRFHRALGEGASAEVSRLLAGAFTGVYLAVWTHSWTGASFPPHHLELDLLLALACVAVAWRARRAVFVVPPAAAGVHLLIQIEWITAPIGALQWGVSSIALGFFLLLGATAASWRLRWRLSSESGAGGLSPPRRDP